MSKRSLPFYSSFFEVFEIHVVEKWEAKEFVTKILEKYPPTLSNRQRVYQGINVLVECGYLKKVTNPRKKNTFLYSETNRVQEYKSTKTQEKIEKVLIEKMNIIEENISIKNNEVTFINELQNEYPTISAQINIIEKEHRIELNDLTTKKNVIQKLMKRFKIKLVQP